MEQTDDSAFVDPNVIMGKGNIICEGVVIRAGVVIGDNNYFGPYCIIGDYPEKEGYFDKYGQVSIGDNNIFTKQVTIDSGTTVGTRIGNNCRFLKNSHVGHDATICNEVTLSCNVCIGGFTIVGIRSNFGIGAVAHQRLVIPEGIMVGMNAVITKRSKLEPHRKYVGIPVRDIGPNEK